MGIAVHSAPLHWQTDDSSSPPQPSLPPSLSYRLLHSRAPSSSAFLSQDKEEERKDKYQCGFLVEVKRFSCFCDLFAPKRTPTCCLARSLDFVRWLMGEVFLRRSPFFCGVFPNGHAIQRWQLHLLGKLLSPTAYSSICQCILSVCTLLIGYIIYGHQRIDHSGSRLTLHKSAYIIRAKDWTNGINYSYT